MESDKFYLRTWGDFACFTPAVLKVERVSYSVPTPSAMRGILESILYRPEFRWRVHRVAVHKPIRFISLRRNEIKRRVPMKLVDSWMWGARPEPLLAEEDRTQRHTLALCGVAYVIEASFKLTDAVNAPSRTAGGTCTTKSEDLVAKYCQMFARRARNGQCFYQPCFGCREFPAYFDLVDASGLVVSGCPNSDIDLGLMLYDVFDLDMVHSPGKVGDSKPQSTVFHGELKAGLVNIPPWEEIKKQIGKKP
jgi:CRISPR-associated protein Cas5d